MSTTPIVILIVVGLVLITIGVIFLVRHRRSQRLRSDFGAEYDREVASASSRSAAEKDLQQRQKRHSTFNIRPLDTAECDGYRRSWDQLQAKFVDSPANAVREADSLVISIMAARGYPTDDFDQRAEDMSVEHPEVVQHYRDAHRVAMAQKTGDAGTEDLRKAAISYRSLVNALLVDKTEDQQQHRNGSMNSPTQNSPTHTGATAPRSVPSSAEQGTNTHRSQA